MFRQIVIPTDNTLTLQIPNEWIGKKVEIIAKSIDKTPTSSLETERKDVQKMFNNCRVSLSNFVFNRDEANDYNE